MKTALRILMSGLLVAMASANATSPEDTGSTSKRTIRIVSATIPVSPDPTKIWHHFHGLILSATLQGLVRTTSGGQIEGVLARKWAINKELTQYTFELSQANRFCNGEQVTAQDVAWSISRVFWAGENTSLSARMLYGKVKGSDNPKAGEILEGLKVHSPSSITIELTRPSQDFLEALGNSDFGAIRMEGEQIVTSGKYCVSDYSSTHMNLKPNRFHPEYSEDMPRMRIDNVGSADAAMKLAAENRIDLAFGYADADVIPSRVPPNFRAVGLETLGMLHMFINDLEDILKNRDFRSDLSRLLRSTAHSSSITGNFIEPLNTLIPKGLLPKQYYARAEDSLSPELFRRTWSAKLKGKRPLKIFFREEYLYSTFVEDLKQTLSQAGIPFIGERLPVSKMVPVIRDKSYDLIMIGFFAIVTDPIAFLVPLRSDSLLRFGSFPGKEFEANYERISSAQSGAERMKSLAIAISEFEREAYVIPMFRLRYPVVHSRSIELPSTRYRFGLDLTALRFGDGQ